jgi:hypothetical protein
MRGRSRRRLYPTTPSGAAAFGVLAHVLPIFLIFQSRGAANSIREQRHLHQVSYAAPRSRAFFRHFLQSSDCPNRRSVNEFPRSAMLDKALNAL